MVKPKKCKACEKEFTPFKSTDKHCSLECSKGAQKPRTATKKKKATKAKKKTKPIGKLTDEAATLLQKLVRLKAADDNGYCSCVTCGVTKKWNDGMQGGHWRPRGKAGTKLMEENIHPQCDSCNGFGMKFHGKEAEYTIYMIDMYGKDFTDEMIRISNAPHKWNRLELENMISELKERVKEQEVRFH